MYVYESTFAHTYIHIDMYVCMSVWVYYDLYVISSLINGSQKSYHSKMAVDTVRKVEE